MLAAVPPREATLRWGVRRLVKRSFLIWACAFLTGVVLVLWFFLLAAYAGVLTVDDDFLRVDFSAFWVASTLALQNEASQAYDLEVMWREQTQFPGSDERYFPWQYPPIFLFLVLPLGFLPFAMSFFAWVVGTAGFALGAVRRIASDQTLAVLVAISFPASLANIIIGQNGLLLAGLFAWGMLLLRERPYLAGVLLGLMAVKPQFFPLVLIALLAGRHTRAAGAALGTIAVLSVASLLLFGAGAWDGFLSITTDSVDSVYGGDARLPKMQSAIGILLGLGAPLLAAQMAQLVIAGACAAFVVWLWRSRVASEYQFAGLACAILLASPYSYLYDFTLLGMAIIWLAKRWSLDNWIPFGPELLLIAWCIPVISLVLGFSLAPVLLLLLIGVIVRIHARPGLKVRLSGAGRNP